LEDAPERLMQVRGRHTGGVELVIRFRKETLDQELILEGGGAPLYPEICMLRQTFGKSAFSPKDYQEATGSSRQTSTRHIARLVQADALRKKGYGEYVLWP